MQNVTLANLPPGITSPGYKMVFLVGMQASKDMDVKIKLEQEIVDHGDILQVRFPEEYRNLVFKSWSMLEWFSKWCSKSQYLLKIDDDGFLNLPKLSDIIQTVYQRAKGDFILGRFVLNHVPPRNKSSKWYVSEKVFNKTRLPHFVNGAAYVISKMAVTQIINHCTDVPLIPVEDIFITGFCREKAGIKAIYDHRLCSTTQTLEYIPKFCATLHHHGKKLWSYSSHRKNISEEFDYAYNNGYIY